jgi:hypothetical protein
MNASLPADLVQATNVELLATQWPVVRAVWGSSMFGAFASVGADGAPHVTPIGSVYLHPTEPRGYYHPIFSTRLRKNLQERACFELLFVDGRATRWLTALIRGRFNGPLAVRLSGHAVGSRRAATEEEAERWQRRVRAVRWTRGYDLLWKDVRFVQEIAFDAAVPVRFGAMSR